MTTKVKARCVSKKQSQSYAQGNPIQHEIELEVPYDQNSIYYKLSGGTNIVLRTINQEAAAMFDIGKDFEILVSPWVEETQQ